VSERPLAAAAARVQAALAARGAPCLVRELPASTRTAVEAANAIGCTVAQIVKSLVFRRRDDQAAVLALVSGTNQADLAALGALVGAPLERADADFVRRVTGYAIGGIPPLGHATALPTWIDADLLALGEVWAAAGTPHAVFSLEAASLPMLTGGTVGRFGRAG